MMHEAVHGATHRNRGLNTLIGRIFGTFSFLPFDPWRDVHLAHHTWTGNVDRDPSMKLLRDFRDRGHRVKGISAFFWTSRIPGLAIEQHVVFWTATMAINRVGFLASTLLYFALAIKTIGLPSVLSGVVLYLMMVEVVNFPHHLGLAQSGGDAKFTPSEQTAFTRSCPYPKWIAHHVLLNFNLHTEHHLFPAHPWYQLDEIHRQLTGAEVNWRSKNSWTKENRKRPLGEVFSETFSEGVEKKQSA